MPPPLSIVIPSHSRVDLLARCLSSVRTFAPAGAQVLVVDDGSRDGVISRTAAAFAGVTTVRLPRRSGFCAAANAGIDAAVGDVVELLNDDTEVTAGWADAALEWFADPRIGAVAPLVLQDDPERRRRGLPPLIDSAGDDYDPGGFAWKRGHGQPWRGAAGSPADRSGQGEVVRGASAAAAFYRRAAVQSVGGFSRDFGAYFEDVDLSCRLRRLGLTIWHDPRSIVWHRVSASYGRSPGRRLLEQQSCNEERVFWRNLGRPDRARQLGRHLAVLAGKALRRFEEGALAPWVVGRARAWWGMATFASWVGQPAAKDEGRFGPGPH
jgi:GT2 family glycosyltransferase